jgi:hypothetical protein
MSEPMVASAMLMLSVPTACASLADGASPTVLAHVASSAHMPEPVSRTSEAGAPLIRASRKT